MRPNSEQEIEARTTVNSTEESLAIIEFYYFLKRPTHCNTAMYGRRVTRLINHKGRVSCLVLTYKRPTF